MNKTTLFRNLCLAGAVAVSALSGTTVFAADKVKFQLDWLPGGDKAPIYVGIKKGFFEDVDLDVSVASGRGSTDAISKLATGNADMGLSDLVALLMAKAQNDVPVSAVYSVFSKAPHAFFVPADSDIKSVKDVAGKRIATSPYTSSNVFLPLLLEVNNVDPDSIKLVKADAGALNPMLLSGNTDVVISWITDTVIYQQQAKSAGQTLRVLPWYDAGLEFYSTSVIASDRFINQHPDTVKRFIEAYKKAIAYTWEHPEESGQIVHDIVPEVDASTATDTINSIKSLVYNAVSDQDGYGAFTKERLATTWKWTAEAQNIPVGSFDPESAVNRQFIP
ncbi:ABC transporter substrate-binding protein [Marinomonas rhizomae]|uniref:ABC transporter substrate-binding protein n=1 Tax=Marinomonas rhizomae TaxID=491948 RepID=UPI002108545C|nr:ABC transporter substrate-binding protein [Marinomonas rhizomae]UTV99246.1 ABC transporter substrate-binding protein [Marinomonas rhizomae]